MNVQFNKASVIEKLLTKAANLAEKYLERKEEVRPPEKSIIPRQRESLRDLRQQNADFLVLVEKINQNTSECAYIRAFNRLLIKINKPG